MSRLYRRPIIPARGGRDGLQVASTPHRVHALGFETPLDLRWQGFWRANYVVGKPWVGEASEGYPLGRLLSDPTFAPFGGLAQNGYVPADFDGVSNILRTSEPVEGTYIGPTTCTIHAVINVRSAPAPSTEVWDDPCIVVTENSATVALGVSSDGVRFGVYQTGGQVRTAAIALSAGYHVIQARMDGVNASVRVDGGAWESVAASDFAVDPANVLLVGRDYLGTTVALDALILEIGVSAEAFSDAQLDAVTSYANARYGLGTGIPCLVVLDGYVRQRPSVAPWGQRIIWNGSTLTTAVSSGRSLVVDPDGKVRQANVGEPVLVPP